MSRDSRGKHIFINIKIIIMIITVAIMMMISKNVVVGGMSGMGMELLESKDIFRIF